MSLNIQELEAEILDQYFEKKITTVDTWFFRGKRFLRRKKYDEPEQTIFKNNGGKKVETNKLEHHNKTIEGL